MTLHHYCGIQPSVTLHSPCSASSTMTRFGTITLHPHSCGTSPTMILYYSHGSTSPSVTLHPHCGTQATMTLPHPHLSTLPSVVFHLIMVFSSQWLFTCTLAAILHDTSPCCVTSLPWPFTLIEASHPLWLFTVSVELHPLWLLTLSWHKPSVALHLDCVDCQVNSDLVPISSYILFPCFWQVFQAHFRECVLLPPSSAPFQDTNTRYHFSFSYCIITTTFLFSSCAYHFVLGCHPSPQQVRSQHL